VIFRDPAIRKKAETRTGIHDLTDLYKLVDSLKAVASFHCNGKQ